jgi:hypothetical protein
MTYKVNSAPHKKTSKIFLCEHFVHNQPTRGERARAPRQQICNIAQTDSDGKREQLI